jgi:ParB family chromosome partitioning protein
MPVITTGPPVLHATMIAAGQLKPNRFSLSIYGDPAAEIDDLLPSIREHGILVAIVVVPGPEKALFEVISGHRRLVCAHALGITTVPCEVRHLPNSEARCCAILEYNRQRRKTFSQLMREADAIEELWTSNASLRRLSNLRGQEVLPKLDNAPDRRNSDDRSDFNDQDFGHDENGSTHKQRHGRTDTAIARLLNLGGKDLYRQARAIWRLAQAGDVRALSGVNQLDASTKTIHAVHKDLRRRDRFSADFRPTPYDVWSFRHDRAFGIPHPGTIPPGIVAHTLHYFSPSDGLVVDPMAGGGTTLDVCQSMGRRCLAYDLHPTRPDIHVHDIQCGFPPEANGCDLIFCDPPYHTMLANQYSCDAVSKAPLSAWIRFLHKLTCHAFETLRPGGYLALLLAAQTEKDLPAGFGYLDHAFYGYMAGLRAGFLPERRISCPMDGSYLPQHIRRARTDGRLLGQVRDLLVMRKSEKSRERNIADILHMQETPAE